jgi:hypothetical protein
MSEHLELDYLTWQMLRRMTWLHLHRQRCTARELRLVGRDWDLRPDLDSLRQAIRRIQVDRLAAYDGECFAITEAGARFVGIEDEIVESAVLARRRMADRRGT